MKVTVCDVCERKEEGVHPEWIEASIPAAMLGELGERLHVDVCSLECLSAIGGGGEEEPTPEPEERQIALPQRTAPEDVPTTASVPGGSLRYMTPEESSEATGVVRRY